MDFLIGLILLLIIVTLVVGTIAAFVGLLVYSFWFRLVVGAILIWLIWSSVTPVGTTAAWIGTVLIGLGVISPWLLVVAVGGLILGWLLVRNR